MTSHSAVASGGILTPKAATEIVQATSATVSAAEEIYDLIDDYNNCLDSYMDVLNSTDNIHYN
ncbi:MAG: hypothetical protein ATN32_07270 [Candidatus Epulonipiscium fishelsonii]|nr:MAG: hypothetical protein ATN32_07270 [Epulopiscium sp. AS2M-Bin002]